jgi:hypothetical protein
MSFQFHDFSYLNIQLLLDGLQGFVSQFFSLEYFQIEPLRNIRIIWLFVMVMVVVIPMIVLFT